MVIIIGSLLLDVGNIYVIINNFKLHFYLILSNTDTVRYYYKYMYYHYIIIYKVKLMYHFINYDLMLNSNVNIKILLNILYILT